MKTPTKPAANRYALPSGQIVNLPDHCTDAAERFTLADRKVVWAIRVGGDAAEIARLINKPL